MAIRFTLSLILALCAGAVAAQVGPAVQSGGVGDDERRALESDVRYNLKVVTANRAGEYVAGVDVAVLDARGERVVSTRMEGPWLLAELPPGRYRVVAAFEGAQQSRDVVLGGRRQEVLLHWNERGLR
jgi:hypothetical protein